MTGSYRIPTGRRGTVCCDCLYINNIYTIPTLVGTCSCCEALVSIFSTYAERKSKTPKTIRIPLWSHCKVSKDLPRLTVDNDDPILSLLPSCCSKLHIKCDESLHTRSFSSTTGKHVDCHSNWSTQYYDPWVNNQAGPQEHLYTFISANLLGSLLCLWYKLLQTTRQDTRHKRTSERSKTHS